MNNWIKIGYSPRFGNAYACRKCRYNFTDEDAKNHGFTCPKCGCWNVNEEQEEEDGKNGDHGKDPSGDSANR